MRDKVYIGYIHGGMLEHDFTRCLFNLLAYDSNHARYFDGQKIGHIKGAYLDDNRNMLAEEFLKTDNEWFLSFDTDHKFTPEMIYELIKTAQINHYPILSMLYFGELVQGEVMPVWFQHPEGEECLRSLSSLSTGQIYELDAVGMGGCLIHREVFEAFLKVPEWASDSWTWFGRDQFHWKGKTLHYGEDMCFCVRAKKLGFQTRGHSGLILDHIKKWDLNLKMVIEKAAAKAPRYGVTNV